MAPSLSARTISPAFALAASMVGVLAGGGAAWALAAGHPAVGGWLTILAADAVAVGIAGGSGRPRAAFAAELADRVVDAEVMGTLAWIAFPEAPRTTVAAVALLSASAVTAYLRAKARGLGYVVAEWPAYTALRALPLALGLILGITETGAWVSLGFVVGVGLVRWFTVAHQKEAT